MNFLKGKKLPIGHFFLALAAGLMLFLLPTEAKVQCEQQFWLLYVLSVSVAITVVLLLIVKKYEVMGVALITATSLLAIRFVFETIASAINGNSKPLGEELTLYDMISWVLIWFIPFAITTSIKLFAVASWNTREKRYGFSKFLFLSSMALLIIYVMIIFCKDIFPFNSNFSGDRQVVVVPFMRIVKCLTGEHTTGIFYILWHCVLFIPIGFFLPIFISKIRLVPIILIGIASGAFLELCQLVLNTGSVCLDDIIMYTIGAMFGYGLKLLIEKTRSVLTLGHDTNMLKLYYIDKKDE
ncbi:MAG: VanZ family protein [Candidatus Pseudoruminococcus sp.]|nr:VanZ family protein [Ruminococcus sp.]MDY2783182.1 VanZ family protein [Candidatus Pseudoruminococcus sp.]